MTPSPLPIGSYKHGPVDVDNGANESSGRSPGIGRHDARSPQTTARVCTALRPQTLRSEVVGHQTSAFLPFVALVSRTSERQRPAGRGSTRGTRKDTKRGNTRSDLPGRSLGGRRPCADQPWPGSWFGF